MKCFFSFFFLVCSLFNGITYGQSVQLKVHSVDVRPSANYAKMKGTANSRKLIDGELADHKTMWLDTLSLGWQNHEFVEFGLELASESIISSIDVSSAKNEVAGVYAPLSIVAFGSLKGDNFTYLGELKPTDNLFEGRYQKINLQLSSNPINVRFVKLVVVTRGTLFFADEIMVNGMEGVLVDSEPERLSESDINQIVSNSKKSAVNKLILLSKVEAVYKKFNSEEKRRIVSLINAEEGLYQDDVFQGYSKAIESGSFLAKSVGSLFFSNSDTGVELSKVNGELMLNSHTGRNNVFYFSLTNGLGKRATTAFDIKIEGGNSLEMTFFEVLSVNTRNLKSIPEVLKPLDNNEIELGPGQVKHYALFFKTVTALNSSAEVFLKDQPNIKFKIQIKSIDIDKGPAMRKYDELNINVWPYYSSPFFSGRENAIKADLKNHHANVFVIPAKVLLPNNIETSHKELKSYLRNYNSGDKVLLFINHRPYVQSPGNYMQDSWKRKFLIWYKEVFAILEAHGIAQDLVYLYPFDEVRKNEIPLYYDFATWVKSQGIGAKLFCTVFPDRYNKDVGRVTDIVQVLLTENNKYPLTMLDEIKELWVYDIMDNSKELSPYFKYRLMSWKAYLLKAKGIGFWNYADMHGVSVWDDFDGGRADYNVVYDEGDTVLSSKRWEAFKQGVEDHYIIRRYEERFGRSATQKIVDIVLSSLAENEADKQVSKMLNQLDSSR